MQRIWEQGLELLPFFKKQTFIWQFYDVEEGVNGKEAKKGTINSNLGGCILANIQIL